MTVNHAINISLVAAYHPDSNLTLAAINKIQVGAGISLLSTLEESLSRLQESAQFNLSGSIDLFYSTDSLIPKYITKWVQNGNNSWLRPTWRNFLTILNKDMKEVTIAEQIEKYLTESTAHIAENDEKPTEFSGKYVHTYYVYTLSLLKLMHVSIIINLLCQSRSLSS